MATEYFTLTEFRGLPDMGSQQAYPDARIEAAEDYIVGTLEREVNTAFVERTRVETHDGGCYSILLDHAYVQSITSVTVDGTALTVSELQAPAGLLQRIVADTPQWFDNGHQNVVVTYVYGYSSTPPLDIKEAVMQGVRSYLLSKKTSGGTDDRRTQLSTEGGTMSLVIAGEDRPTGYPELDAVINRWHGAEAGFA